LRQLNISSNTEETTNKQKKNEHPTMANNNNVPPIRNNDDDDTRYAVDIRVFVSVIVIAMAVSFGVGVGLGPNGNLATIVDYPQQNQPKHQPLPAVTSVQVAEAENFPSEVHDQLHEPAGQVRLRQRRQEWAIHVFFTN
jgi:hypothetical protein